LLGLLSVLSVVSVLSVFSGCEAGSGAARISDAWMSADEEGAERVATYAQDAIFYAHVELTDAPADTNLKASWVAVEVDDADPGLIIDEVETATSSGPTFFTLTNEGPWPLGTYRVELYVGDELLKSVEFDVR